jgi:hypothetical protein
MINKAPLANGALFLHGSWPFVLNQVAKSWIKKAFPA